MLRRATNTMTTNTMTTNNMIASNAVFGSWKIYYAAER